MMDEQGWIHGHSTRIPVSALPVSRQDGLNDGLTDTVGYRTAHPRIKTGLSNDLRQIDS